MKGFTLALVGIASMATLAAQRSANGGQTTYSPAKYVRTAEKADTVILPTSFGNGTCDSLYLINAELASGTDSVPGFVFGANMYLDESKGYQFNSSGTVSAVIASIAWKFKFDTTAAGGSYYAKLYDNSQQLIATSLPVHYDSISVNPDTTFKIPVTMFIFPTSPNVSGNFYVMVDAFDLADTTSGIGILSNGYACGSDKSYERFYPQGDTTVVFSKVSDYWTRPGTSQPLLADPMIMVVVENVMGQETLTPSSLMAYPNPATNSTTITFGSKAEGTATIEVMNLAGQLVMATSAEVFNGKNSVNLNIEGLNSGIYMFRVTMGADVQTGKLVVNH